MTSHIEDPFDIKIFYASLHIQELLYSTVYSNDMHFKKVSDLKLVQLTHIYMAALAHLTCLSHLLNKRGSQYSMVPRLWAGHPRQHSLIPGWGQEILFFPWE